MSLSSIIGAYATETRGSAIPPAAIEAGRVTAVDCIACTIAGTATDVGRIIRNVARTGSTGSSTIIGTRSRVRAQDAALANGTAGHALDFDDVLWTIYGHPSVAVLPAALAVAEERGLSGQALLEAYVLGIEVTSRIGRFVNPWHYEHGWHTTNTIGVFGAAVAAARLMGLTADQTATAVAIAASSSAGVRRNFGSMTKPFHAGNAARAGVLAAELAAAGMTADREAVEGRFGWLEVFGAREMPTESAFAESLHGTWDIIDPGIVLKRYGACGCTHCALDAVVEIKETHGFDASEVASVECRAHPLAKKVLQHSRPNTGLEGKFSMEHSLAVALVVGMPGLVHYQDEWVQDRRVRALVPLIAFKEDAGLVETPSADGVPADVTVTLRDGRVLHARVTVPIGDPRRPMSTEDRARKFSTCTEGLLDEQTSRAVWRRLERLEQEAELSDLLGAMTTKAR